MKMKIPFVNLKTQYENLRKELTDSFEAVASSGMYILGNQLKKFENEISNLCETKYAVGVANGTDALFLSLKVLDVGENDEVITAPNSFIATAGAIIATGAKPVFADIREDFNISPESIEAKISSKTKAIIPVHFTGRPACMDEIREIADSKRLYIVEDAAQAIGAKYKSKPVGALGHLGCFSLHPLKNLHLYGDGGIITTNHKELYSRLCLLRNHGLINRDECATWGYNSRLDELQAAFGIKKIKYIKAWNQRYREIAQMYNKGLKDFVTCPADNSELECVFHNYMIIAEQRDKLIEFLTEKGIETKIHYPIPIHLQKVGLELGYKKGDFPVAEEICDKMVSLPIYPELTNDQIEFVVDGIKEFYQ